MVRVKTFVVSGLSIDVLVLVLVGGEMKGGTKRVRLVPVPISTLTPSASRYGSLCDVYTPDSEGSCRSSMQTEVGMSVPTGLRSVVKNSLNRVRKIRGVDVGSAIER